MRTAVASEASVLTAKYPVKFVTETHLVPRSKESFQVT